LAREIKVEDKAMRDSEDEWKSKVLQALQATAENTGEMKEDIKEMNSQLNKIERTIKDIRGSIKDIYIDIDSDKYSREESFKFQITLVEEVDLLINYAEEQCKLLKKVLEK
jgi:septal ring factor EnvC (AmiA/AmiB activator)